MKFFYLSILILLLFSACTPTTLRNNKVSYENDFIAWAKENAQALPLNKKVTIVNSPILEKP
jgi:hypothetical protein